MYYILQVGTDKRFVEWQHHFSVLLLEISGNEIKYSSGGFPTFLCLLLPLKVFGDNDSKISLLFSYWHLLVGHGVVAIYVLVSNVHQCTFVNIEFHLPLVGIIFQLVDVFLKLYYVLWVSCFVAEFGVISKVGYFVMMLLSRSLMYMKNSCWNSTLPCGTPEVTGVESLWVWLIQTLWRRPAS